VERVAFDVENHSLDIRLTGGIIDLHHPIIASDGVRVKRMHEENRQGPLETAFLQ
jgi:hypothetical protein